MMEQLLLSAAEFSVSGLQLLRQVSGLPEAPDESRALSPELRCLVTKLPDVVLERQDFAWFVRLQARQILNR